MYLKDGVRLAQGTDLGGGRFDLPRAPASGRAIIGDPRNDENSIVNQIQAGFIEFHNEVGATGPHHAVERQGAVRAGTARGALDVSARAGRRPSAAPGALAQRHVIRQWERFFPNSALEDDVTVFSPGKAPVRNDSADDEPGKPRPRFAYKIDPSVVDPLANLPPSVAGDPPPSLIVRNLWRGAAFQLPSGQRVAKALNVQRLSTEQLVVRKQIRDDPKVFAFERIDVRWDDATPLWFYVLAEAQAPLVAKFGIGNEITEDMLKGPDGCGVQMGPVGGRILLEVFSDLLDSDAESYRNHPDAADWTPMVAKPRMWDVLNFRA